MRWLAPEQGTRRDRSGFLWLPLRINGETRWLERAKWREWYLDDEWEPGCWLDGETMEVGRG